jgi:RNA polymerase sigma-70 factor, ECF subfamily
MSRNAIEAIEVVLVNAVTETPLTRMRREILETLYRDHFAWAVHIAICLGSPRGDAEDTVHDIFVKIQKRLQRSKGSCSLPTNIQAWLFVAIRNAIRDQRRHVWVQRVLAKLGFGQEPVQTAEDLFVGHEKALACQAALNALSAREREVLVLAEIEERSTSEIAVVLRLSPDAVRKRLQRARLAFRKGLHRQQLVRK